MDSANPLAGRREAVIKRWLGMEVERASLDELARVSLSDRLAALESMFDAALEELKVSAPAREPSVRDRIEHVIAGDAGSGRPLTLLLVQAAGVSAEERERLAQALEDGAAVLDCDGERLAVLLPNIGPATAPAVAERVRLRIWELCGGERAPDWGGASYPHDARDGGELLGLAFERLAAQRDTDWGEQPPPASVSLLHRPLAEGRFEARPHEPAPLT